MSKKRINRHLIAEKLQQLSKEICKECSGPDYNICTKCPQHNLINEILEEL